ncbi:YeiH family protein [Cellulomonas iranensis]|uniref:YeiH family protein n=1 Tax=Cellulomonas iranensis TaxID=76862 RepID=UPI003D7E0A36
MPPVPTRVTPHRTRATTPGATARPAPTSPATTLACLALRRGRALTPGLALCAAATLASLGAAHVLPGVSPLVVAIALGVVLANTTGAPAAAGPGLAVAARRLLRVGVVLLGLRLALADVAALGAPLLAVVVVVVAGGVLGTLALGRALRVPAHLAVLVACGFSICGAAAVAAAAGVTDPDDEAEQDTVTAVALVVVFGTLMIGLVPLVAPLLGLRGARAGAWAGASVHEVAQVVAVGGALGGAALTAAVVVKLARVLLLAPVVAALALHRRRAVRAADGPTTTGRRPPVVPLFVAGFLAMVVVRSTVPLPDGLLAAAGTAQTALLTAAMFALGCGVRFAALRAVGLRPVVLAVLSTAWVAGLAAVGVLLAT